MTVTITWKMLQRENVCSKTSSYLHNYTIYTLPLFDKIWNT